MNSKQRIFLHDFNEMSVIFTYSLTLSDVSRRGMMGNIVTTMTPTAASQTGVLVEGVVQNKMAELNVPPMITVIAVGARGDHLALDALEGK